MALSIKSSYLNSVKGADYFVLRDTTGVYSGTNTGGYGTPNPERASLILFILADRIVKGVRSALVVTPQNTDLTTNANWDVKTEDGAIETLLFTTSQWVDGAYSKNTVVYNEGKTYKAVSDMTSGLLTEKDKWSPITTIKDYPFPSGNYHLGDKLHNLHTYACIADEYIKSGLDCSCKCGKEGATNLREAMHMFVGSSFGYVRPGAKGEAAEILLAAYSVCTCNCGCK